MLLQIAQTQTNINSLEMFDAALAQLFNTGGAILQICRAWSYPAAAGAMLWTSFQCMMLAVKGRFDDIPPLVIFLFGRLTFVSFALTFYITPIPGIGVAFPDIFTAMGRELAGAIENRQPECGPGPDQCLHARIAASTGMELLRTVRLLVCVRRHDHARWGSLSGGQPWLLSHRDRQGIRTSVTRGVPGPRLAAEVLELGELYVRLLVLSTGGRSGRAGDLDIPREHLPEHDPPRLFAGPDDGHDVLPDLVDCRDRVPGVQDAAYCCGVVRRWPGHAGSEFASELRAMVYMIAEVSMNQISPPIHPQLEASYHFPVDLLERSNRRLCVIVFALALAVLGTIAGLVVLALRRDPVTWSR